MDHRPPSIKVDKPWGRFEQYTHNLPSTVKIITVAPGGTLSRQYHHRRDELWVILDNGAQVQLGEKVLEPETGEKIFIPRGTVHRLSTAGESEVRILEISFGEFDEEDIVRLDDVARSRDVGDGVEQRAGAPAGQLDAGAGRHPGQRPRRRRAAACPRGRRSGGRIVRRVAATGEEEKAHHQRARRDPAAHAWCLARRRSGATELDVVVDRSVRGLPLRRSVPPWMGQSPALPVRATARFQRCTR